MYTVHGYPQKEVIVNYFVESYIEIICPDTKRNEKLWYRNISGTNLFVCNGCENATGSHTCQNCIEEVTEELRST